MKIYLGSDQLQQILEQNPDCEIAITEKVIKTAVSQHMSILTDSQLKPRVESIAKNIFESHFGDILADHSSVSIPANSQFMTRLQRTIETACETFITDHDLIASVQFKVAALLCDFEQQLMDVVTKTVETKLPHKINVMIHSEVERRLKEIIKLSQEGDENAATD